MHAHKQIQIVPIGTIFPYPANPRKISAQAVSAVAGSIKAFGFKSPIVVDKDNVIINGHTRLQAAQQLGMTEVPVIVADDLTPDQVRAYRLADNRVAEFSEWDADFLRNELEAIECNLDFAGFDEVLEELKLEDEPETMDKGDPDEVPAEAQGEPVSQRGEVFELGPHRLMCGDSTSAEDWRALMGPEQAELLHADPPYGMGKEKDGVENDNLYDDKLDTFQMQWWKAVRRYLKDNASAYIWGNAPDLWRLWYRGGLADSERLTLRNEITWDKREENPTMLVSGVPLESRRMYHPTERCLFFMLGEQGFNNNADNYWEGWEPIRTYLETEMKRCGWTVKDLNRITGTQMGGHWVTKSQWALITAEHYGKIQKAARDHGAFKRDHDAFKREHDELKQAFYATRAYFDNTHDNMTDVWDFKRVTGEDRHGHATPKPVDMMARIMKSSCPSGGLVIEPFGGSGSTLIGAAKTGRVCRAMEISPRYCDVIRRRWTKFAKENNVEAGSGALE
jgi:DNA modification methylase